MGSVKNLVNNSATLFMLEITLQEVDLELPHNP